MRLKLEENPREWLKFTAVMGTLFCVLALLLYSPAFPLAFAVSLIAVITCAARPRWFRGFYRGGMTVSFYVGQLIGRILLTVLFVLVVTPMGLLLRLFGKDLLQLKRSANANTHWRQARTSDQFDRMF